MVEITRFDLNPLSDSTVQLTLSIKLTFGFSDLVSMKTNVYLVPEVSHTFAPVASHDTIRAFAMTATTKKMTIKKMDVSSVYLPFTMVEPVYVRPPKGIPGVDEPKIWKCTKALYGLKNAGRSWYRTMKGKLEAF